MRACALGLICMMASTQPNLSAPDAARRQLQRDTKDSRVFTHCLVVNGQPVGCWDECQVVGRVGKLLFIL